MTNRLRSAGWLWMADDRHGDGKYWRCLDSPAARDIYDDENLDDGAHYFPMPGKTHRVGVSKTMRLWCGNVARNRPGAYGEAKTAVYAEYVVAMHMNVPWESIKKTIQANIDLMINGKTVRAHLQPVNTNLHFPQKKDAKRHQVHILVWAHNPDDYEVMGAITGSKAYKFAEEDQGQFTVEARRLSDTNLKNEVNIWL